MYVQYMIRITIRNVDRESKVGRSLTLTMEDHILRGCVRGMDGKDTTYIFYLGRMRGKGHIIYIII